MSVKRKSSQEKADIKKARLAEALRRNLRRRKASPAAAAQDDHSADEDGSS